MPNPVYYKKDPNLADLKTNSDTLVTDSATIKADVATTKGSAGTIATNSGTLKDDIALIKAAQTVSTDSSTGAVNTIDYAHHEIHSGSSFHAHHTATSKNDGQTINLYIKTPDTAKWGHCLFSWSAGGAAYGRIREAPSVTSNTGTNAQPIYNHNRNSATASTMVDNATSPAAGKYGIDVTVTAGGKVIYEEYSGSGISFGGGGRNDEEFILGQNTAYVFEVESDAAGITLNLSLSWYEHTNR